MKIALKVLGELLGAAIGAAILWASLPLFLIVLSAAGAFFEAYGVFVLLCFPLYIVIYIGRAFYEEYKDRKARI